MSEIRPEVCRGCRQPIQWKWTPAGKWMPLDVEPMPAYQPGAYVLEGDKRCRPAEPMFDGDAPMYLNHWSTCSMADQFKTKAGKR